MPTTNTTTALPATAADNWDPEPHPWPIGPAEALDDCPDCGGRVQRLARHSEGLGELWELPLSVNSLAPDPRLRGPGFITLAFAARAQAVSA